MLKNNRVKNKKIVTQYNPNEIEKKWYSYWIKYNYFISKPNNQKSYTIVIPPPNVTGTLHIGHLLNNTIQDILIRKSRMQGFNACWVPGIDHASIATEAKIVSFLKDKNLSKSKIGKKKFLEYAQIWSKNHEKIIIEQLKRLGCSCDWNRKRFTLDHDFSKSVRKIFIHLYNEGKIYKGKKIINWDPKAKTSISDEEVKYIEKEGKLFFLKYFIENSNKYILVATTRPETIFGDVAICIHPKDDRYFNLKGKKLIIPIVNRLIPIIYDSYVDTNFGTGAVKITPSNDPNDYIIAKKYKIQEIEILNKDGSLNHNGLHYEGKDRFLVRKEIEIELNQKKLLCKIQNFIHRVGVSERTGTIIEYKISTQWFLKMKDIVKPALESVLNKKISFFPKKYIHIYENWIKNITDWNISRQLWWGHQIPVFYFNKNLDDFVVAENIEDALILAKKKSNNLNLKVNDLIQEEDVLDTWFSSWIWPIAVFNGINEPNNNEIKYYYPTQDLITGPDIIFFWVTRMIVAGYLFKNEKPFNNVYFTGIVRDKLGKKMSKQLGNFPDSIELINKYGADAVRIGVMITSSSGNDLKFDEKLCIQGRNFCNKLWNAFRLISSWKVQKTYFPDSEKEIIIWFENQLYAILKKIDSFYIKYRISDVLLLVYKLIWDDFCSWYLETIKPLGENQIYYTTYNKTIEFLEILLKILHPFMPFITEEIWQSIFNRSPKKALIISDYPKIKEFNKIELDQFKLTKNCILKIRNYRKEFHISSIHSLDLYIQNINFNHISIIKKICNIKNIFFNKKPTSKYISILIEKIEILIPIFLNEKINNIFFIKKEKILYEIKRLEKYLNLINQKLNNKKFSSNVEKNIIELEKKKQQDIKQKIEILNNQLKTIYD